MDVAVTLKLTADEFQTLRTELKERETQMRADYAIAEGMGKTKIRPKLAALQFLIEKLG
jgi:hypothetical protein